MVTNMRTLSTTGDFMIEDDSGSRRIYRELVMEQDSDESWLVYVVDPAAVGRDGEAMGSASIRVKDEAGKQLIADIFAMVKVTGTEYEGR